MKNTGIKLILAIGIVGVMLFISSCLSGVDQPTSQEVLNDYLKQIDKTKLASDVKVIDDSLAKWGFTAQTEPQGVRYIIHTLGTGARPTLDNQITVKYTGKLFTNKNVFDSNTTGLTYPLNRFIAGWQTAIPLLPEGTIATLYIPSGLAYGPQTVKDNNGNDLIPAHSNLIFEIELDGVH